MNTLIQAWNVLLGVCCALICLVLCAQLCVWMDAVSASLQGFPKRKIGLDVEVIRYLRLEHRWLQRLPSARLWDRAGWESVGGALPGEGDQFLSGQGWQCSCRAVFSGWSLVPQCEVQVRRFVCPSRRWGMCPTGWHFCWWREGMHG